MAVIKYRLVIPSRGRADKIARILALLPTAIVCVDEREHLEYRKAIPVKKLWLHAPTGTLGEVRQWVLDNSQEEAVVMIDDDFRCVRTLVGRRTRKIVDPGAILQIIENGINVAADLGIHLFGWNRCVMLRQFYAYDPLSFGALASGAWGVVGREHAVDVRLNLAESLDLTLTNLLENRIVLHDRRFYFDCGPTWKGTGGLQGIRTSTTEGQEKEWMAEKWGQYVSMERKLQSGGTGMSIRVQRRCSLGGASA